MRRFFLYAFMVMYRGRVSSQMPVVVEIPGISLGIKKPVKFEFELKIVLKEQCKGVTMLEMIFLVAQTVIEWVLHFRSVS